MADCSKNARCVDLAWQRLKFGFSHSLTIFLIWKILTIMKSISKSSLSQTFNSSPGASSSSGSSSEPTARVPAPALVSRDAPAPRRRNNSNLLAIVLRRTSNAGVGGVAQRSGRSHGLCENPSAASASGRSGSAGSLEDLFSAQTLSDEVLETVASLKNQSGKDAIGQIINLAVGLSHEQKAVLLQWAAHNVPDLVTPQDLNYGINEIADTTLQEPLDDAQKAEVLIALVSKLDGLENDEERNAFFIKMQNAANNMAQEPQVALLEALAHVIGKLHPDYRGAAFHLVKTAADDLSPPCKSSVLGHLAERISDLIGEHEMINAVDLLMRSAMQGQPQTSFLSKMTGVIHHFTNEEECSRAIDMMFAAIERLGSGRNRVLVLKALARQIPLLKNEQARSNLFDKTFDAAKNLLGPYRSEVLKSLNDMTQGLPAGEERLEAEKKISEVRPSLNKRKKEENHSLRKKASGNSSVGRLRKAIDRPFVTASRLDPARKVHALSALAAQMRSCQTERERHYVLEKILIAVRALPPQYGNKVLSTLVKQIPSFPTEQERTAVLEKILTATMALPPQYGVNVLHGLTEQIWSYRTEQERTYALEKTWAAAMALPLEYGVDVLYGVMEQISSFPTPQERTSALEKTWAVAINLPPQYGSQMLCELTEQIPSFPTEQERTSVLERTLAAAMALPPEHRISLLKRLASMSKHSPAGERRFEVVQQILNVERLDSLFSLPMEKKVELLRIAAGSIPNMLSLKQYQAFIIILDSVRDERVDFVKDGAHALQVLEALATILPALERQKFDAFKLLMAAGDRLETQQKTVLLCSLAKAAQSVKQDAFSQVMDKAEELPVDCQTEVLKALSGMLFEARGQQQNTGRAFFNKVSRLPADLKIAVYETVLSQISSHTFSAEKDQLQKYVSILLEGAREELQRALRNSQA